MNTILTLSGVALAALCWIVVAFGAATAIFSRVIHDPVYERIALSGVAICAVSKAWRIYAGGWTSQGDMWFAVACAVYTLALFWKHRK